jgi:hypothetical protein
MTRDAAPRFLFTTAVLALLTGCEPIATSTDVTREIEQLKKTVAEQRAAQTSQASDIGFLKLQLEWLQSKTIFVDVSTQSYQCIDTNTGKFLIACDNVQPYADGQKLTFRVGNPNFVTFTGFRFKVKWGAKAPPYPQNAPPAAVTAWQASYTDWQKSLHEKDIDSAIELKPGVWNVAEIVLSPAKVEELGYLELSMTTDKVLLYRDKTR